MDDDREQTMEFVNRALDMLGEAKTENNSLVYALLAIAFAEHRQANALVRIANKLENRYEFPK